MLISSATSLQAVEKSSFQRTAEHILQDAGVKGGLVVHLGCGDGKLTAALCTNDSFVVHGLDADVKNISAARDYVLGLGLYGRVSVEYWSRDILPYSENLVNLLVAQDLRQISMAEVMRVLCPGGIAYLKNGDGWTKTVKSWPEDIDEWTHFLHDSTNNAVADDKQVGPPRRLRWICGPLWARSHEFISSLCAMVSANGRLFYIFDEGLTGVTTESIPEKWTLIGRDAFNGILLWKRPLPQWSSQWKSRELRSVPLSVQHRLVAEGDRVFLTFGYDEPVSALDASTGEILRHYDGTEGTEEIRCVQGILVLRKGNNKLMAIESDTGKKLWEVEGKIQQLTLAILDDRVFYQDGQQTVCLDLRGGEENWRIPSKSQVSLLLVNKQHVLLLGKQAIQALSPDTGTSIWTVDTGVTRNEAFIANNQLWHWGGESIVGRSLETGNVATRLDTSDVFTPGHHLRCYQSKATNNFIITPNRGAEFVSIAGGENTENDWVRGACRYGVMPSYGLLYVPQNPCFCYPGVKITGMNALAPAYPGGAAVGEPSPSIRLEKGKAYGFATELAKGKQDNADDWPMYRHDARRSGAADFEIAPEVSMSWRVQLRGSLTPPVASSGRVYVAAKDEHTIYAFDITDGHRLWQFTAGGRIDSAPSIYGGLILFGSADGYVYCLLTSDGQLAWRFRAAPMDQRIIAFGQLESPWRVHGSVLIIDNVAYFTAGRSSYLDGGIWVYGLAPATGKILYETKLDTWARTRKDAEGKPFIPGYYMEGTHSDILVSEGDYIFLGQVKFDRKLVEQKAPYTLPDPAEKLVAMDLSNEPYTVADAEPDQDYEVHQRQWLEKTQKQLLADLRGAYGGYNIGQRKMGLHVLATGGFLDDSWFNRTYWMYSDSWPGYYLANRAAKTGQLLVVGPDNTYAVQAYPSRNLQSPLFTPGEKGYLLFADRNGSEPVLDYRTRGTTKGWGFTRTEPPVWYDWVPIRIRGMVLVGSNLFVAGPPDVVQSSDPMAAFEGRAGALLRVYSAADGKKLAEQRIDALPVFDGLVAASGRLLLSLRDGSLLCMASVK